MIIDFHTHTFPDKIAARTIEYLSAKGNIKPFSDGTVSGLKASMKRAGVDISVVLPVATSPHQVDTINRLSAELSGREGVYFFGAIHPECENVGAILDFIKSAGLRGVKIHPDYQNAFFDDKRYVNIIGEAVSRDLLVVTHAGLDVAYPDCIHCTPDMVLRVMKEVGAPLENKLILAHLGGFGLADEVLAKLAGLPVYMDTAVVLDYYPEKGLEIMRRHGFDKILFASDSPWADQGRFVSIVKDMRLDEADEKRVFGSNAASLLKIDL